MWCVDGTFSVAPSLFFQLLTISYIARHHVFPAIFILLPNKTQALYLKIYRLLKKLVPGLEAEIVISDFELASLNALELAWPGVSIQGCYFHFSQCVYRKIVEMGLKTRYVEDRQIYKYCKALLSLAYINETEAFSTFTELSNNIERTVELNNLHVYFSKTFIVDESYQFS